jgi:hypothetical protein
MHAKTTPQHNEIFTAIILQPNFLFDSHQTDFRNNPFLFSLLAWRNWLARSTVNREVGGSSPSVSVRLRSVMVITLVFESNNPSSILGATF